MKSKLVNWRRHGVAAAWLAAIHSLQVVHASTAAVGNARTAEVRLHLPTWSRPPGDPGLGFDLDGASPKFLIWGRETVKAATEAPMAAVRPGGRAREYFEELLPALFERTLMLSAETPPAEFDWLFTGERGGLTLSIGPQRVELVVRYYDSPAFNEIAGGTPPRYPEWKAPPVSIAYEGTLQAVTVALDHKLGLAVALNGREVMRQPCWLDVSRHQLQLREPAARVRGEILRPAPVTTTVQVDSSRRHQAMIGFGGIAAPTAYAQLSAAGRERWWQLLAEYNLLIQREYPNGQRLNPAMDNWDRLADATPHNYGDNFPNGEISDFDYIKRLRQLGGQVWFEFWGLPLWVGSDVEKYADAVIRYCEISRRKTGAPPEIVGIQNEVEQTPAQWQAMTLALRRRLDAAGFTAVRIHMSDDGALRGGIKRAEVFRNSVPVWAAIDYAAAHMYDYQRSFTEPDNYDATLRQWKETIGDKPFLSTELCVNDGRYQVPSYRLALLMGQLYHKNLVLTDAAAICYCWTLLNVEQPSFGWTRTLFAPDPTNGFMPKATSHQLRVFGAYSRRISQGMSRVEATSSSNDLLVSAFEAGSGRRTLVMINRATRPQRANVIWPQACFESVEAVDPYRANEVRPAWKADEFTVEPGQIITLTSQPLRELPPPAMTSAVFDWTAIPEKPSQSGSTRSFFQGSTAMLDKLSCHVTTLRPGQDPHPPHQHPEEELYLIKEGTVEVLINGERRQVGAGSVIYAAANQPHGIRNAGLTAATYYVIKWKAPTAGGAQLK